MLDYLPLTSIDNNQEIVQETNHESSKIVKQAFAQPPTPDDDIGRIKNYAVYGLNSVSIGQNVTINSGNVGAHDSVAGLQLGSNSAEVSIESNAKVIGTNSVVAGDSLRIKIGAIVQNVFFNEILNQGTIQGTQNTPLQLPVVRCLPAFPDFEAGTTQISVAAGSSLTISSGDFGDIVVQRSATLIFTGGVYNVKSIDAQKDSKLLFDDATQIRVKEGIRWAKGVTVGPSSMSSIDASSIVFLVEGLSASINEVLTTELGKDAVVKANIYAPNADILLKKGTAATGGFVGKNVSVEIDSTVTHKPALDCSIITWNPASLTLEAKAFVPVRLNFTSSEPIQNAQVNISGEIDGLVNPDPSLFTNVSTGMMENLLLTILIPPSSASGWHNGTISLSINGIQLSQSFDISIFIPAIVSETTQTPDGNYTYVATPSFSPFFNDTFDITFYFTFANGTTVPLRTFYDVFANSSGGQMQTSSGFATFAVQNQRIPIANYFGSFTNNLLSPPLWKMSEALAVIGPPVTESECTEYAIRYDFRNKSNIVDDLDVAADALTVSDRNPLIIRADIFWSEVDEGFIGSNGDWVHTGFNNSTIDDLFSNVVTEGKKAYVILGVHDPPEAIANKGRTSTQFGEIVHAQYLPLFRDDADRFIEHVINYIQQNGWLERVEFWQVDNEPNMHPLPEMVTGVPQIDLFFIDWETTTDALKEWLETVRSFDPDRSKVINVYQSSSTLAFPQSVFLSNRAIEPFRNLLSSNPTIGHLLASNMNLMGFDIYPDHWVEPDLGGRTVNVANGFHEALVLGGSQFELAKNDFGFTERWGIAEMPTGPRAPFPRTEQVTPEDVSDMFSIARSTTQFLDERPALIGLFQLRAANEGEEAENPPFNEAYGLINDGDGTVNTDFRDSIKNSVVQNCPGEIQFGSISGEVFNDSNGNGVEDNSEIGLAGWILKLTFRNGTLLTATTDTVGNYTFADLPSGTYIVEIAVQPGFRKTAPILGAYVIDLLPGQIVTGRDFGNTPSDL